MLRIEFSNLDTVPTFQAMTYNVPDPSQKYTLYYRQNPFFTDRLCVAVDTQNPSLLKSVEFSTQDGTPGIAIAISELLAKTTNVGSAIARARVARQRSALPFPTSKLVFTVDLSIPGALQRVNQKLGKMYPGLSINIPGFEQFLEGDGQSRCEDKGICFRTAVKAPIHLLYNGVQVSEAKDATASTDQYSFAIINHRHVGNMDLDRAFLVEKVVRLGFTNGILSHVVMRKPSEVVQAVKLPLSVVDVILSVPANFASKIAAGTASSTSADQLAAINAKLDAVEKRYAANALGDAEYKAVFALTCTGSLQKTM